MCLQEGSFLTAQALADPDRLEEGGALYVAVTRAIARHPLPDDRRLPPTARASRFLERSQTAYSYR
jgi:hypothetical protein